MQAPDTRRLLGHLLADAFVFAFVSYQWHSVELGPTGGDVDGRHRLLTILACLLVYVPVRYFSICIHEGSHALAAYVAGCRVTGLVVGNGPRLATGRLGTVDVTLHLLPAGGHTTYRSASSTRIKPVQRRWVAAAGPASHIVLAAVAATLAVQTHSWARGLAVAALCQQITLFINNAMRRPPVAGVRLASDGWMFHENRPHGPAARLHAAEVTSAGGHPEQGYELLRRALVSNPADVKSRLYLARHAYLSGRFSEAAAIHRAVSMALPDGIAAHARLLLATADAEAAQTLVDSAIPEAEAAAFWNAALSNPALPQHGSSVSAIRRSAAVIKLVLGDAEAALQLCQSASRDPGLARPDAALVAATAAMAAIRTGRAEAARDWAARVPVWCPLRPAVDRELGTLVS